LQIKGHDAVFGTAQEAFWAGNPLDRQRTSHLARLELGLAA